MPKTNPPFRADVVGSILRTAPLKEARAKREKGEITAAQLTEVENREIEKIIKKQEEVGLKVATDGEFRRSWWHFDFYGLLDGMERYTLDHGIQFHGVQSRMESIRVTGKLGFSNHPMLEHFKFLKAHTRVTPKMCIPSPATLHFRLEPNAVTTKDYADRDAIFDDLAKTYKQAIRGFYEAGCRYLQFDDTAWAYLCSPAELKKARDRGLNADRLQQDYARVINGALAGKPNDMTITTHVCRGNFRSTWISEGGYEPVAEIMLGQLNYDAYSSNTTPHAPAASSRCVFCPKATRSSCSVLSPPNPASLRTKTTSSGASRRRPNTPRSTSFACRRNAVLPRPKKATCSPKTSNGRSSGWSWNWRKRCGADPMPLVPAKARTEFWISAYAGQ